MKQFAKRTFRALTSIIGAPFYVWYGLSKRLAGPRAALEGMAQFLALFPGTSGNWLRQGAYRGIFARCSDTCTICFGALFSDPRVVIGEHVYIGPNCDIGCAVIEDDVLLGSGVHLLSGKQQHFSSDPNIPIRLQGGEFRTIRIGHGSWVGNGAIIMADVGHDAIVGAGAVVTHDVEPYSIVAGNPATVIRKRRSDMLEPTPAAGEAPPVCADHQPDVAHRHDHDSATI